MKNKKIMAGKTISRLELKAMRKYCENTNWWYVIDMLDKDEKKELDEAHKILFDEDYPSLKGE